MSESGSASSATSPAALWEKVTYWIAAAAVMAGNGLDIWTTEKNFTLGGGEANQLMLWLQQSIGAAWWIPKTAALALIYALFGFAVYRAPYRAVRAAMLFFAFVGVGVYVLVVKDNFAVMRELLSHASAVG